MDNGGGDGICCFEIKIGAVTAKFTNVRIALDFIPRPRREKGIIKWAAVSVCPSVCRVP